MEASDDLVFYVNGKKIREKNPDPEWTLVYYLRHNLDLVGSKVGCSEGGCGACTVIISRKNSVTNTTSHKAVNACITTLCSVYGCHILTVEGLTDNNKNCHIIQDQIARNHGTQCGFCSPGMVLSMYALTAEHGKCQQDSEGKKSQDVIQVKDIKTALQGNLCRCTGYRPILEAFSKGCSQKTVDLEDLCRSREQNVCLETLPTVTNDQADKLKLIENLLSNFEEELQRQVKEQNRTCLQFTKKADENGGDVDFLWLQPLTLGATFRILQDNERARVIGGSTELFNLTSVVQEDGLKPTAFVHIGKVPELNVIERHDKDEEFGYIKLGGALTIAEMIQALNEDIQRLPEWRTRNFKSIVRHMEVFGSTQIRNSATIGGSLMAATQASDIKIFYSAFQCWAHRYSLQHQHLLSKKIPLTTEIKSFLTHLEIPYTKKNEYTWIQKVSRRKHCDAAIVNAAGRICMDDTKKFVHNLVLTFGGLGVQKFDVDFVFERNLVKLDEKFLAEVEKTVLTELKPNLIVNGETQQYSAVYISSIIKNLVKKFYLFVKQEVEGQQQHLEGDETENQFTSSQLYTLAEDGKSTDLVGKPIVHSSAYKHATGVARYCDDIPKINNELSMVLVVSERAHAEIVNVDPSLALKVEGVVGYVSAKDFENPTRNSFGIVVIDEEIFASSKVTTYGQVIGGVVATDRNIAKRAAKLVKIEYKNIEPLIITIEDAIKHSSYYQEFGIKLKREADNMPPIDKCENVLEGEMRVGNQAHFYMEPQACIAIPNGEDGEMEIISSTQNPNDVQGKVAEALGVPANRIVVKVKRIGGGFGGKETRCLLVALPTAIAAQKFGKPVRCILDRKTDMLISGKRHTFLARYKVGFSNEGRLQILKMVLYCDGGNTLDISGGAVERAAVNMDNAYNIPHFDIDGIVCKTNTASNTAFRGTGGPQAALIIEGIMDRIATHLKSDPVKLRHLNMYVEGDFTPYGQQLTNCTVHKCWDECIRLSNYYSRKEQVDEFNRNNKFKKRGISMNPAHFGIAYTAVFLNQGAALIHIYRDGSVLITTGGVEIGQGLYTKMIQVATRELGIESSKIRISETSTDKVPNPTPTSASSSSDMIGMAIVFACQELIKRLKPYREAKEDDKWEDVVSRAYFDRVSLSATGFYKVPGIGWNEDRIGSPFNYYSTGAAVSEVELDCLTGEHTIIETCIVMDVGKSLNPSIDVGQIEGAFMQGVGFFTTEELVLRQSGELVSVGPNSYKIPTINNAPRGFHVSLLPGSANPKAIYSSKTVGEPPLLLATTVFYAVKDAIRAYRIGEGLRSDFSLNSPATVERILMALTDAVA